MGEKKRIFGTFFQKIPLRPPFPGYQCGAWVGETSNPPLWKRGLGRFVDQHSFVVFRLRMTAAFLVIFGVSLLAAPSMGAERTVVNGVVAVVNGTPITLYQVEQRVSVIKQKYPDSKDIKKKALDDLIDDDIIYDELGTMGVTINSGDVDNAIEQMSRANGISLDALKQSLESKGIDFAAYRDSVKGELAKSKLVGYKFRSEVTITNDDIQRYYVDHKDEFTAVREANISHILIEVPPDVSPGDEKRELDKAGKIMAQIKGGESFSNAAGDYSDDKFTKANGGYLGDVQQGSLYPVLDKAIFAAAAGTLLGPIRTPAGYEIIMVNGFESTQSLPLSAVRDRIRNALFTEKLDAALKNWLLTKRQKTIITVYNNLL